jgi:peptidoglycan/xylan/chitin deacetylase (PgdA/CDA1 family)
MFKDKETIQTKEYKEDYITIVYPFFNNEKIDNYIDNYLKEVINDFQKNNSNSNLYMDYDYLDNSDNVNLTFYKYVTLDNIIKETQDNYIVNINNSAIDKNNTIVTSNYVYDGYYQKIIDKSKPMIALTFDDGPNYNTSKIIDILNKYNVKATFFLLGTNIKGNEDIIRKMASNGMEIGNHTYSHRLLTRLKKEEIEEEFNKTNDLVFEIIGKYPTLTRPSYGSTTNTIRSIVTTPIIIWDVDTLDWKYHNSNKIYSKVIDRVSDGDIILMHDIYSATANSLEMIIPKLLEEGYQLVTVTELFYYKEIELNIGKVYGLAK